MAKQERSGFGTFLRLLILIILLVVAYQLWKGPSGDKIPLTAVPPAGSRAAAVPGPSRVPSATPSAAPAPPGGQARLADPGDLSASAHAGSLKTINDLIEQGNEVEAEARLSALPQEALGDQRVRRVAAVLWNNLGVRKGTGRGAAAGVSAFKHAVTLDPDSPTATLNLVHAYWELKDPALTPEFLEKAIRLVPDDPLPHLALADKLYDKDDLAGAAPHLDHATQRATQHPALLAYLEIVTAKVKRAEKAEQKFASRASSHFTVKFDGNEDYETWTQVLDLLEDSYRDIGQKFGYFPSTPIMVVLHTREVFQSATGSPAWADGLFDPILGRIKIPTQGALTDRAWLARVLRHEFVHALLHERTGGQLRAVPTWLNEGLAMQLAGDPWPDLDQVIRGEVTLIPLNHLEGGWGGFPANVATVAYLEGNSATVYLIERFGMEKVREIIGVLATGQPIAAAVQDRLFMPYEQFQRQWVENINEKLRSGKT